MLIIGERINGMYPEVKKAIVERSASFIETLARNQVSAGCNALDISVGPLKGDVTDHMEWLVSTVAGVVGDVSLCIDSPHPDVISAGLKKAPGRTIINSLKKSDEHINKLLSLALSKGSDIICLLMTDKGIPQGIDEKVMVAVDILEKIASAGIDPSRILFDPILLPVANAQKDVAETFAVMDQLQLLMSPPPGIVVGLSNLSQRAGYRSLLNRTYCSMAISHGLSAVILDPFDEKLMKTVKTAQIIMNRELYAKSYLKD